MANTEQKGLTQFMRELRKVLPPGVEKLDRSTPTYRIGGLVFITLHYYYYCRRDSQKEQERTCYPTSVTVSLDAEGIGEALWGKKRQRSISNLSNIWRTRTIQVRDSNLEGTLRSVSTAVNSGLAKAQDYVTEQKKAAVDEAEFHKGYKARIKELYKTLGSPKSLEIDGDGVSSRQYSYRNFHVDIDLRPSRFDDKEDPSFDINIQRIPMDSLTPEVLKALKQLIAIGDK